MSTGLRVTVCVVVFLSLSDGRIVGQRPGAFQNTYVNPIHRWSVSYPDGWQLDSTDPDQVMIKTPPSQPVGLVGIHALPPSWARGSLDEVADNVLREWGQALQARRQNHRTISRRRVFLANDVPALEIINLIGVGVVGRSRKVIISRDDYAFLIDAETEESSWSTLGSQLEQIANSFTIRTGPVPQVEDAATSGIIGFHKRVEIAAQNPPEEKTLRIACQRNQDQGWVTFIGSGDAQSGRVAIAAYTGQKLERPDQTLHLRPFRSGNSAVVSAGDVLDWGYVFDRNADGMVDYFAFLVGAIPVKPESFQGELPKRGGRITADQINLHNRHARLVFVDIADDDFDGKIDGFVFGVREPDEIWIDRWVAARSTKGDGQLDQAWFFINDIASRTGVPERSGEGWAVARVGSTTAVLDGPELTAWSDYVARLNRVAKSCGFGPTTFNRR
jgi:hypothetical protein